MVKKYVEISMQKNDNGNFKFRISNFSEKKCTN